MICNAEIHIYRADPTKHEGRTGFLWALTVGCDYYTQTGPPYLTRHATATAAVFFLDDLERMSHGYGGPHTPVKKQGYGANPRRCAWK